MNNYFRVDKEDSEKVKELLEGENIAFICTNLSHMVTLENNFHVSECGNYILAESRVFEEGYEQQLLHSNLEVLECKDGKVSIFQNEQTLDDVWEFKEWKTIERW